VLLYVTMQYLFSIVSFAAIVDLATITRVSILMFLN
jgi:hypothetical protein